MPTCKSCGGVAPLDGNTTSQHLAAPSAPSLTTSFELKWPSSLPFVTETPDVSPPEEKIAEQKKLPPKDLIGWDPLHSNQPAGNRPRPETNPGTTTKIRLLELSKGNYDDPIRIELQVEDVAHKPEYEALSYTWGDKNGDSSTSERVYIGRHWDILPITRNCANALRRLRYSGRSRKLWVDAICINQSDVDERSHQVGIMQSIYATAERVLIYLGENSKDENTKTSVPWNYDVWNVRSLPTDIDLTQEPYFERVWVIQEIASGKTPWVLFGTRGDRWRDFIRQVEETKNQNRKSTANTEQRNVGVDDESNQLHLQQNWFHVLPQGKLMDLQELPRFLQATARCKATDPRDRVYALLGLFQGVNQAQLTADYSLSVEQVFSGLTACMLCQSPAFMLPIFAALQPSTSSLPTSWAIDWSSASSLNIMELHLPQADSQPYLVSEPEGLPRFYRNGTLILRGRFMSHLSSCLFDSESRKGPPGVLKGYVYRISETLSAESLPEWAESTDEVLEIRGLRNHALVLRPVTKTPKTYRFVAIAKQSDFDRISEYINRLDRTVLLLFSAWQYVLRAAGHGEIWFQTVTWDTIKDICWELKHARNSEADDKGPPRADSGNSLRARVRRYKDNETSDRTPDRWATISELRETAPSTWERSWREARDPEEDKIAQATFAWEWGADPAGDELGGYRRKVPWHREYFEESRIRQSLERFLGVYSYGYRVRDYETEDMWRPTQGELARALLSQGLDQKILRFEVMSMQTRGALLRQDALGQKAVPWAHDSLNLNVEKPPEEDWTFKYPGRFQTLEDYETLTKSHLKSWAADFINSWTLLVNEKPRSFETPLFEIAEEGHSSETGIQATEKSIRTKLDSRFTTSEVKPAPPDLASGVNWEPLLDLVRETEAQILPLEEAFTRTDDTYDGDMKGAPWEDIRII